MRRRDLDLLSELFHVGEHGRPLTGAIADGVKSPLIASGILVRDREADSWETQEHPYFTPVMHDREGRPFYSDGAIHMLEGDDLQCWRIDTPRFVEILAGTFGCTDRLREVVPNVLWNLGPSNEKLGRCPSRDVYFSPKVESCRCEAIANLPQDARSYILVAGWTRPGCEFDGEIARHVFPMREALELADDGTWSVRRERIDRNFAPATPGGKTGPDPAFEKKKARLAQTFFDLCFALRTNYDFRCAERKRLQTDKAICDQTGLDKSFVSRTIGDRAVLKNTADPVASFWRGVFMDEEKFGIFDTWLRNTNVGAKQKLGPVHLKEELVKYMGMEAVKAARKMPR